VSALTSLCLGAAASPEPTIPNGYGLGACVEARQKPAASLWLTLRCHLQPFGWGRMTEYAWLPLGEFRVPGAEQQTVSVAASDRVGLTYRLAGKETDGAVKVTVNRLTPALLVELEGTAIALFAGDKTGWTHPQFQEEWRKRVPVATPRAPRAYAVSRGQSVECGTVSPSGVTLAGAERGWVLLWYGRDTWFYTGNALMGPTRLMPGDAPLLLVCSQPPTVKLTGDQGAGPGGSLVFTFPRPGARMVLLPLYGYRFAAAGDTQKWSDGLPEEVRKRCDWWAARLSEYPTAVEESLAYDSDSDTVTMKATFAYTSVRPGGQRCAPVPPMLELARQQGFPVSLPRPVVDSGLLAYCGPYAVIEKTDGYSAGIRGLGKYTWERARIKPTSAAGAGATAVQAELNAEVDRILAAGHLAPVNLPWKVSYGWGAFYFSSVRHLYSAPGQTLSVLARALPFLDAQRQQRVRVYLEAERTKFRPEQLAHLPADVGARREPWTVTESFLKTETNKLRDQNFHVRTKTVPAQALYDLACYYAAVGFDKMAHDGFDLDAAVARTVEPWFQREDWATLGWRDWPLGQRDPQYYASYGWNQPADVNRQAAALIGLARLARAAKNRQRESLAIMHLAKVLVHRYAAGEYAGWLYKQGGVLPAPPEGLSPADDPRAATVSEAWAYLGYGQNQEGPMPYFNDEEGPYAAIVPELARFLADYLKPQAEGFARATAAYYPDAFLTLGTPRRCAEWWHNYPQDPHQIFLVHAWILGQGGDWLRRRLDVPLVPVGDLYYIDKLVAALGAYGQTTWEK
jgi:hypothetical protein